MYAAGYIDQLEAQNQKLSHRLTLLTEHTQKLAHQLKQERENNLQTRQILLDLGKEVSRERMRLFGR